MTAVAYAPIRVKPVAAVRQRRLRWPWWVALVAFAHYIAVGIWLVKVQKYLLLDGASRTITAEIMVLSRDPHLGAMGFYWPPLPMLVRIPFVLLLAPFHQVLLAGAFSTAVLSALTIPVLAAIARELHLSPASRVILIGLYAANPVVIFYAANGMSEACFSLFVAVSYLGYLRFSRSRQTTDLRLLSIGLAFGMMSRIEFIPITVGFLVACFLLIPRNRWKRAAVLIVLPPLYVFLLWTWASSLLAKEAFFWYRVGKASGKTPAEHPWLPDQITPITIVGFVARMSLVYAPVLIGLLACGVIRSVPRARWLGLVLTTLVLPAFIALQLQIQASLGAQRYFSTLTIVGTVAGMWVLSATAGLERGRRWAHAAVIAAMVVGTIAVVPLNNDKYQSSLQGERAFFSPLIGEDPGIYLNYWELAEVQTLVSKMDSIMVDGDHVAMDSQGGLALLYTRHPDRFILPEDREFEEIMSDPEGRFNYVVRPVVGLDSQYRQSIDAAMKSTVRGKFVLVEKVTAAELWKYVPNSELTAASNTKGT